jgi:hypothetical protein
MARATPSLTFSTKSIPSPHQRVLRLPHSGGYNQIRDYATSISVPSHEATSCHTAIYPGQLLASSSLGPIWRHCSVTPSLARCGGTFIAHILPPWPVSQLQGTDPITLVQFLPTLVRLSRVQELTTFRWITTPRSPVACHPTLLVQARHLDRTQPIYQIR